MSARRYRPWSDNDDLQLAALYRAGATDVEIGRALDRTPRAVHHRRGMHGHTATLCQERKSIPAPRLSADVPASLQLRRQENDRRTRAALSFACAGLPENWTPGDPLPAPCRPGVR